MDRATIFRVFRLRCDETNKSSKLAEITNIYFYVGLGLEIWENVDEIGLDVFDVVCGALRMKLEKC